MSAEEIFEKAIKTTKETKKADGQKKKNQVNETTRCNE
jgi:hypothetical protein